MITRFVLEQCEVGSYETSEGCVECPEGTFSGDGATKCSSCPEGKVSPPGSTSEDDCSWGLLEIILTL